MRHQKELKLNGLEITVKELTVRQIIAISRSFAPDKVKDGEEDDVSSFAFVIEEIKKHLPLVIQGVTLEQLMDLTPGEIDDIYQAFKEVNTTFLGVAEKMGLGNIVNEMLSAMRKDFSVLRANS